MGSRKQIKSFLNNPYCKNSATLPSKSLTKTFLSYFKVSPAPSTKWNLVQSSIINCQLIIGLFERGNKRAPMVVVPAGVVVSMVQRVGPTISRSLAYGLLYSARSIFLIALLLYLVILAIVDIVNYSRGIIKI